MATMKWAPTSGDIAARQPVRRLAALLLAALMALVLAPAALAQGAAPAAAPSPGYVLGPNDAISVIVYGQSEFSVATRVKADGSIVLPLIGKVQAQGKTVLTLADEITRRLVQGNYLREPIVNVEVTDPASSFVRVAGKVGAPGLVPLDRSTRLLDVLLRSGWVQDSGSEIIFIRRAATNQEIEVSTKDLARGTIADVTLQPGDTVFVPASEIVYLTGAAMSPGSYPLKRDMTVSELLAMAGGVGPMGSSGRFGLKRGDEKEVDVTGTEKLQAGDVIRVRERLF
jgi:polysaccharide biosynthesis/export protein